MFHKALTLVLLGVVSMGAGTIAYGTFYDEGFTASVAGVMGLGDSGHEGKGEDRDDD